MKEFGEFVKTALEFAFNLYEIVGAIGLLFMVYGFLWLIVSIFWKKVHKESYDYVVDSVLSAFGKKKEEEGKKEEEKKEGN